MKQKTVNSCESQAPIRDVKVQFPHRLSWSWMTKERRNIFSYIRVLKYYIIEQILGNFEPLLLLNKEASFLECLS